MKNIKNFSGLVILPFILAILYLSCASYQSVRFKSAPVAEDSFHKRGIYTNQKAMEPFQQWLCFMAVLVLITIIELGLNI